MAYQYNKKESIKKAEQEKKEMREMIEGMAKTFREDPKQIAELLDFGSRFYKYSVKNQMLIFAQNPYATYVQSYSAWKKAGYQPRDKDNKIKIWTPVRSTMLEVKKNGKVTLVPLKYASAELKNAYKEHKIKSYSQLHYKVGHVYDIANTNFPVEKYPSLYAVGYDSEMHRKVYEGLVKFNQEVLRCSVMEEDMNSIALRGSYSLSSHHIVINDKLKDTEKLSTLAHETGHAITLFEVEAKEDNLRSVREFEADAMGILIVSSMGLPVEEHRKAHLAQNYRKMSQEMEQVGETMHMDVEVSVEGILSNVIELYRKNVDLMQERINQALDPDRGKNIKEKKKEVEVETGKRNLPLTKAPGRSYGRNEDIKRREIEI